MPFSANPVTAQTWNYYSGSNHTIEVGYVDGAMGRDTKAKINLGFPGSTGTPTAAIMDTGSTGIVVGSNHFQPGPNDIPLGPGSQSYGSSGDSYSGTYYNTTVQIYDKTGTTVVATSTVRVLLTDKDPNFIYMGVGFDRGNGAKPDPTQIPVSANPFLNLVGTDGKPLADVRKGYVIKDDRVILGIPNSVNSDYAFVKLEQNSIDWNATSMTVKVTDKTGSSTAIGSGTILQDTGINYMFISPPANSCLEKGGSCRKEEETEDGKKKPPIATDGTQFEIWLPGQTGAKANYIFKVTEGTSDNKLTPERVEIIKDPGIFVNTGREFFTGFDYIYDYTNGFVGYRWNNKLDDAYGGSTASVALIGPVNLQDGFNSSLPTFLMGATTLMQTGIGTISGEISGTGGLTIGSGRVDLTGNNSYSGGTTVAAGATLGIDTDTRLGELSGGLTLDGGALLALGNITSMRSVTLGPSGGNFNTNGHDITLSTPVSGVGGLTKMGLGVLLLQGAQTYTGGTVVNEGILRLGANSSLAPTGGLTVNTGGTFDLNGNNLTVAALSGTGGEIALGASTLTVDGPYNSAIASVLTGTGGLTKDGPGVLSLTGVNTYTGPTSILGGLLAINGSITSDVTVGNGGALGGNGTITGLVTNAGMLSPGNSIGTLNVIGSYAQASGSSYLVETNAQGQADRLNVSGAPGTATIAAGTSVFVAPSASSPYAPRTTYTILNATGGVTGAYSSVSSSLPFLLPSLSYDADNVYLTLQIGGFARQAQTVNQAAVGAALDAGALGATGDFATVLGTFSTLTAQQGIAAINSISGQNYSGFSSAAIATTQVFMTSFANTVGGTSGGSSRVALAEACDVACDTANPGQWGAWGGALGGFGVVGGTANAGTLTYNLGGFAAGIDRKVTPDLLVGVTAGFTSGSQWVGGFSGRGTSDTFQAGLYASYAKGPVYVDGLAAYAYSDNRMTRQIAIPGLAARTANGWTGANLFFGQVETGYRFDIDGRAAAYVTPFARLQGATATQAAFTENGAGSLNLSVASQTTNSLRSVLGAQLGGAMDLGWRERLAVQFKLGWGHEYADTGRPVTASFVGAPALPFTTYGAAPQRDIVVLGLSANTAIADATSVYFRYEGDISSQDSNHALTAGFRMTW